MHYSQKGLNLALKYYCPECYFDKKSNIVSNLALLLFITLCLAKTALVHYITT